MGYEWRIVQRKSPLFWSHRIRKAPVLKPGIT
jgi:hypothetical protein